MNLQIQHIIYVISRFFPKKKQAQDQGLNQKSQIGIQRKMRNFVYFTDQHPVLLSPLVERPAAETAAAFSC